jgi:hypothetical protein
MHDDVNNFVLLTDVLRGYGHEFIDDLVKQFGVAAGVVSYARYQLAYGLFVLFEQKVIDQILEVDREETD